MISSSAKGRIRALDSLRSSSASIVFAVQLSFNLKAIAADEGRYISLKFLVIYVSAEH